MATLGGKDVAGIGPLQSPQAPTAWMVYIGTADADALAARIQAAGGAVIAPPFDVGDQGRMAVFQDPGGAFISAWQPLAMSGFAASGPGTFGWAEVSARGVDRVIPFYESVFGWTHRASPLPQGGEYVEFLSGSESLAGAMEMPPMVPAEVPSYWMVYFNVTDVDAIVCERACGGRAGDAATAGLLGRAPCHRQRSPGGGLRPADHASALARTPSAARIDRF